MLENLGVLKAMFGPRIIRFEWKLVLKATRLYKKITKKDISIKFKHYICNRVSELRHHLDALESEIKAESYTNEELEIVNKYVIKPMNDVSNLMLECTY